MNKSLMRFLTFASVLLVVMVLRLAEDVLIPIALATLLAFLLTPLVVRLQRWGLPKVPAVAITVGLAFTILAVVGWIVALQLVDLAQKLPDYERNIHSKLDRLQEPGRPAALGRMFEMIDNLRADIRESEKEAREAEAERTGEADEPEPVPVEVRPTRLSPLDMVQRFVSPLLGPLGTAGIAIVLLVAMLLQREDLRDRFIKVVSAGRINVATQAVHDAARRVSRYLLMQLVVNGTYGLPVGIGLYFIGIPNALLWGLLATVLRFIPFLGPWIAAIFPLALAAAVAPGWEPLLYTLLLFLVMELVSNNVIEVWLYGAGTGISNLALLVAAVFWTWVWGPIGLFLSTPTTVCLLVIGKYVPGLRFLSMLLGSEPVLEPPAQFYQRMLSMDYDAMFQRASDFARKRSLPEFYDSVYIPALIMAEEDRHRGALAEVRQRFIFESGRELIEDLDRPEEATAENSATGATSPGQVTADNGNGGLRVFLLPARDDADELVALMLQHLLRDRGVFADIAPVSASLQESAERIREGNFDLVVISALPPSAVTAARRVGRFLREHCPEARLLVGIWSEEAHVTDLRQRLRQAQPDAVASRVGEAVALLLRLAPPRQRQPEAAASPVAAALQAMDDAEPAIAPLDLSAAEPDARFDVVARDLAQAFDVPISLVTVVDVDRPFWRTHRGLPPDMAEPNEEKEEKTSMPPPALNGEDFLVVEDARAPDAPSQTPFLVERGIRFYACAALRRASGQSVGTLCVVDTRPRQLRSHEKNLLRQRAQEFMRSVEEAGARE